MNIKGYIHIFNMWIPLTKVIKGVIIFYFVLLHLVIGILWVKNRACKEKHRELKAKVDTLAVYVMELQDYRKTVMHLLNTAFYPEPDADFWADYDKVQRVNYACAALRDTFPLSIGDGEDDNVDKE